MTDHLGRSVCREDALVERQYRDDRAAMDVLRGVADRQAERYEAALVECANCEGVGWHTEIEVQVHGVTIAAGGDCPVCHGKGKVLPDAG